MWQIISVLYGTCFMVYSETGQLSWQILKTCPVMMYHQTGFPQTIWPQGDFAYATVVSVSIALYAIALRNPCTLDRYQVSVTNRQSSSVLLSIHWKSKFKFFFTKKLLNKLFIFRIVLFSFFGNSFYSQAYSKVFSHKHSFFLSLCKRYHLCPCPLHKRCLQSLCQRRSSVDRLFPASFTLPLSWLIVCFA